jgi:hypothetical protein
MAHLDTRSIARTILALGLVAALAACGTAPAASPGPSAVPSAISAVSPTPTMTASASAEATAMVIVAPTVTIEAPLKRLWSYQGKPESPTWAPTIAPDGRIWVAAYMLDQFWILDRDGRLVERWGTSGTGDGELSFKGEQGFAFGSVAFLSDGGFLVGDMRNHRVQRFAADRTFASKFGAFGTDPGQFVTITALALGKDGHIFVDDNDRLDVQEFDADGTPIRTVCPEHSGALIATDVSGALYCLGGKVLDKVAADGTPLWSLDASAYLTLGIGVAIAPNGHVFVASVDPEAPPADAPERLLEVDPDGKLLRVWPTGGEGIAIDPAGDRIYIASSDPTTGVTAYELPLH